MSETANMTDGFECGDVDCIVKPIRAQEVLARLNTRVRHAYDMVGKDVVFVDAHGRIA